MLSHEFDIFKYACANVSHVSFLEAQKLVIFANCEQIDVFETVLGNIKRWMHFTVDDTAFEVELTQLVLHVEEQVAHEQDVDLLDVLHLDGIDAVDLRDHALRVLLQVLKVLGQGVTEYSLLTLVHRLDQEALVE